MQAYAKQAFKFIHPNAFAAPFQMVPGTWQVVPEWVLEDEGYRTHVGNELIIAGTGGAYIQSANVPSAAPVAVKGIQIPDEQDPFAPPAVTPEMFITPKPAKLPTQLDDSQVLDVISNMNLSPNPAPVVTPDMITPLEGAAAPY